MIDDWGTTNLNYSLALSVSWNHLFEKPNNDSSDHWSKKYGIDIDVYDNKDHS